MLSWPERIFCDTSFFFASLDARDTNYAKALIWSEQSRKKQTIFYTTWEVISETVTLLRKKTDYKRTSDFIQKVIPALTIVPIDDSLRQETLELFLRLARDKKLSYCDCLSYVVISTVLDLIPTATFDKHFKMLGLSVLSS